MIKNDRLRKLGGIIRNYTLKQKLILMMTVIFLSLYSILAIYLYIDSSRVLRKEGETILHSSSHQTKINIDYSMNALEDSAFNIVNSSIFQEYISRYSAKKFINENVSFDFQFKVVSYLRMIISNTKEINRVVVNFQNDQFTITQKSFHHEQINNSKLFEKNVLEKNSGWGIEKREETQIYFKLPVSIYDNNENKKSLIVVYANTNSLFNFAESYQNESKNNFYIVNRVGETLFSVSNQKLENGEVNKIIDDSNRMMTVLTENEKTFSVEKLEQSEWYLVGYFFNSQFRPDIGYYFKNTIGVWITLLTVALIVTMVFSEWITRPLALLVYSIDNMTKNSLPTVVKVTSKDEVGRLTQSFNEMLSEIEKQIQMIKFNEQLKKEAEMRAFQAQIQPHFLYNTLAIISWTARKEKNKKLEKVSNDLAKYYRLVLAKGKIVNTLVEEISLIRYYLKIQQWRFPDQLTFDIQVLVDASRYQLLHNILQPLVENAIDHGIFPNGEGTIKVIIKENNHFLIIQICDNGIGTSKDLACRINRGQTFEGENGFSVNSIKILLENYYGKKAAFLFDSERNKGTTVTLLFEKNMVLKDSP